MFGKVLVTHQTGPAGREVRRVYLEEGADIAHEYYLGAVVDRESGRVALIASQAKAASKIESVAAENPDAIVTVPIDPASGFQPHHGRSIAFGLGLSGETAKAAGRLARTDLCRRASAPTRAWWKSTP